MLVVGVQPEDHRQFRAPPHGIERQVSRPRAHLAGAHRQRQHVVVLAQLHRGARAFHREQRSLRHLLDDLGIGEPPGPRLAVAHHHHRHQALRPQQRHANHRDDLHALVGRVGGGVTCQRVAAHIGNHDGTARLQLADHQGAERLDGIAAGHRGHAVGVSPRDLDHLALGVDLAVGATRHLEVQADAGDDFLHHHRRVVEATRGVVNAQQQPVGLFTVLQARFGRPACRNVAGRGRGAKGVAVAVVYRRHRERDIPQLARLGDAHHLEAFGTRTLPHAREQRQLLVVLIGWHQHHDRLADGFEGGVAEQPLGARVPRGNSPLECRADDRVFGGGDDRRD